MLHSSLHESELRGTNAAPSFALYVPALVPLSSLSLGVWVIGFFVLPEAKTSSQCLMWLHKERSSEPHQVLADRLGGASEIFKKTTQ